MAEVTDERGRDAKPEAGEAASVSTAEKNTGQDAPEETKADSTAAEGSPVAAENEDPGLGTVIPSGATPGPSARARASMRSVASPRRARVVIKKLGPWSVLKLSLFFYFCVMIVFLLALVILYLIMSALGTLDAAVKLLSDVALVDPGFKINGPWLLMRVFAGGVALVVLWSVVNVFAVFLYNLISDVIGGIEVTLAERR